MKRVEGFTHRVAVHCESGSLQSLLANAGVKVSEPMIFGVGSGALFYYLFWAKGPAKLPLIGVRNPPGEIWKNVRTLCGIDLYTERQASAQAAMAMADRLIEEGRPCTATVDMFRMRYLPDFLRVHAPFHFVVLIGKEDGGSYRVSDPYMEKVATLSAEDLAAGWETRAPMSQDNLLCYLRKTPGEVDWKGAALKAIRRACRHMLPPPGVRQALFFVGVQGMRHWARKIREWPRVLRGVALREGIIYTAIASEDQGTGGASFRLVYAAFLEEVAALCRSQALGDIARRFVEHGQAWRATMRKVIVLGKTLPDDDGAYDGWYAQNQKALAEGLEELASAIERFASVEEALYRDLGKAVARVS